MFYVVEKEEQLQSLSNLGDCFVSYIPGNYNFHDSLQDVSLIFIRPLNKHKGYIICIEHSESLSLDLEIVNEWLDENTDRMFVVDKKKVMYYFPFKEKLYDLSYLDSSENEYNSCLRFYYENHYSFNKVNTLIPISKHFEYQNQIYRKFKKQINALDVNEPQYKFHNETIVEAFFFIERYGIKISKEKYIEYYSENIAYPQFNISKGRVFSQYNLYTLTSRPSNRFNEINFAALNKTNGVRSTFIPGNDFLVEMDFSAYHPRLISKLIDFDFPDDMNIYEHLARLMFETDDLTKEQLNNCKELTFKQIYGGVYDKYRHIEFFAKIDKFTTECWDELQSTGVYETESRIFKVEDVSSPSTLFNYIIQSTETITNAKLIKQIAEYLLNKQTKLIMYTYDAFLFDYSEEDGLEVIEDLRQLMNYPVKIKRGSDYSSLIPF